MHTVCQGAGKEEWNGEACQRVRDSETLRGEAGEIKFLMSTL